MNTIENNWIIDAQNELSCGGLTVERARSLEIALIYDHMKTINPDLVVADVTTTGDITVTQTLQSLTDKTICGDVLTETEYFWAKAEIARLWKLYYEDTDARLKAFIEDTTHYVYASGIYSWNGGAATAGHKTISGLLTTDVVVATLHSQGAAELLQKASAAAGQINFTLDANGTDGTTKINYVVYRAKPVS